MTDTPARVLTLCRCAEWQAKTEAANADAAFWRSAWEACRWRAEIAETRELELHSDTTKLQDAVNALESELEACREMMATGAEVMARSTDVIRRLSARLTPQGMIGFLAGFWAGLGLGMLARKEDSADA